jgi:hypothetical protein
MRPHPDPRAVDSLQRDAISQHNTNAPHTSHPEHARETLPAAVAFPGDYGRVSLLRSNTVGPALQGTTFAELLHKLSERTHTGVTACRSNELPLGQN